jgi:hypothetical protein
MAGFLFIITSKLKNQTLNKRYAGINRQTKGGSWPYR